MIVRSRKSASGSERGYILITLILFVALITVAALLMAPVIAFQVKRDREEELIHRGVQYSRAMKHYVKKFGRYPTRIEELENTNQVRFLRRRYKDPITGKDFKILRMGDVHLALGGAGIAGAVAPNGLNPAAPGAQTGGPAAGAAGGPGAPPGVAPGRVGANTMNLPGGGGDQNADDSATGTATTQNVNTPKGAAGADADSDDDQDEGNQGTNHPAAGPGAPGTFGAVGQGNTAAGAQVFGGGPMVGVASTSKDKSIRVFSKKDHYNQWQFIYDPNTDTGGLLMTPAQSGLRGATNIQPGTPGAPTPPGSSNPGAQGQPQQPGMQTPQMPPDQDQSP